MVVSPRDVEPLASDRESLGSSIEDLRFSNRQGTPLYDAIALAYDEMSERYQELHRRRGNDLAVGTRLDEFLTAAGLEVIAYEGHINVMTPPPGMRGPAWAARDALLAEGLVTPDDIARWDTAFQQAEQVSTGLRFFGNTYIALGRRS